MKSPIRRGLGNNGPRSRIAGHGRSASIRCDESLAGNADAILELAPLGVLVLDRDLRILRATPHLCAILESPAPPRPRQPLADAFADLAAAIDASCRIVLSTGQLLTGLAVTAGASRNGGGLRELVVSCSPIAAPRRGRPSGVLVLAQRAPAQSQSCEQLESTLAEKTRLLVRTTLLLREINHRVKNSLQMVSSMLRLHMQATREQEVRQDLGAAARRVIAVAKLHDHLFQSADLQSGDAAQRVDVADYLAELCTHFSETLFETDAIDLRIKAEPLEVPLDYAVHLALIVNELATNACKHAFRGAISGTINVRFQVLPDGRRCLAVGDDGSGLRGPSADGFGMTLVRACVAFLGGTVDIETNTLGTCVQIIMPAVA